MGAVPEGAGLIAGDTIGLKDSQLRRRIQVIPHFRSLALLAFAALFGVGASAQQLGPLASAPQSASPSLASPSSETPDKPKDVQSLQGDQQPGEVEGTSKDRLFFTLPNFLTLENAGQVPPLTTGQKFRVVVRSSFDYVEFPWYGFLAGLSQAENSEPGYGQGAAGYGKRYGAAFADGTIENFITSAALPSLLHQDPRFFQEPEGGFWHRTRYAISRIFVTRTDSGGSQINYSEIVGSALAASISTYSYHPRADKTVSNTLSVWGTQVGYDTLTYVVKEFWPDVRRKIRHRKDPELVPAPTRSEAVSSGSKE